VETAAVVVVPGAAVVEDVGVDLTRAGAFSSMSRASDYQFYHPRQ
jgi:hypothetical protein